VDLRTGLDAVEKRKILSLPGLESRPSSPVVRFFLIEKDRVRVQPWVILSV
jgi:hypothetical protein